MSGYIPPETFTGCHNFNPITNFRHVSKLFNVRIPYDSRGECNLRRRGEVASLLHSCTDCCGSAYFNSSKATNMRTHEELKQTPPSAHFCRRQTYELYVVLHAELDMMSHADVFVGTFSSNIGRLVYLMREVNGLPRNSSVSVDVPEWFLGRRVR